LFVILASSIPIEKIKNILIYFLKCLKRCEIAQNWNEVLLEKIIL
jgi:hypothetical protein